MSCGHGTESFPAPATELQAQIYLVEVGAIRTLGWFGASLGWVESTPQPESVCSCCTYTWEKYPVDSWPGKWAWDVLFRWQGEVVMSCFITMPPPRQTGFRQERGFSKTDPSHYHTKPASVVSTSSVPVAWDDSSFTLCQLAMQSLCQHLSHFPEYGRLS